MKPRTLAGLLCASTATLVALLGGAAPAAAFSDPERFTAPAEEGGGGGRFFTGSPADGLTCAVCHEGGTPAQVVLRGLPQSGYAVGQPFEMEVAFPNLQGNHALALEVVDPAGSDIGLELLPEDQILPTERCGGEPTERRASYLTEVGKRRILGVEACEARAVRFRFRGPPMDRAFIVATVLASDNSATVAGDGVTEILEPLQRVGSKNDASSAGCGALPGARATSPLPLLALLVLLVAWRAHRAARS
jgi:hypothetical protein